MTEDDRIPVLKVGGNLLISIQVDISDDIAIHLQENILNQLASSNARGMLIDISILDVIDSFLARTFSTTAQMAAAMDVSVVIAGMQPAVALTLVELGLELTNIQTALNVEHGMELLETRKRQLTER